MHTPHRWKLLVLLLGALALLASACGDSDGDGDEASAQPATDDTAAPDAETAFPVTIDHIWGSATIEERPERVVTLGYTDADVALALGVTPVAITGYSFLENGLGPWATPLVEGELPELLAGEPNVEQIASLRPDLIIAINAGFEEPVYDQLAEIAPTVVRPAGTNAYQVSRDDATRMISTSLGQAERGEELIEETNARFEQAVAENPQLEDMTGVAVLPYDSKYGAYTPRDTRGQFMTQLGLDLPPALAELDTGEAFYIEVSQERAPLLDADVVVMLADDPAAREFVDNDPVLQNVPVVRDGRMLIPDTDTRGAMTYNTVLSAPYALDQLLPQILSAVADR